MIDGSKKDLPEKRILKYNDTHKVIQFSDNYCGKFESSKIKTSQLFLFVVGCCVSTIN